MSDMNIEFEYQIRHNLKNWLTNGAAPAAPVEQAPLDGSDAPAPVPYDSGAPAAPAPVPSYTPAYPPTYGAPQQQPQ